MLHIRNQDRDGNLESDSDSENEECRNGADKRKESRVILLLDMDCFEVQVLAKAEYADSYCPDFPAVVINHDNIILSLNYAAKRLGVKRSDSLDLANEKCDMDLQVLQTGTRYGKSDSFTPYKESDEILQSILDYQDNHPSITINRASKDEFYLDVTAEVGNRMMAREEFQFLPPKKAVFCLTQETKGNLDSHYNDEPTTVMHGRDVRIYGNTLNYRIRQVYKNLETARPYHRDEIRLVFGALIAREILREIYQSSGGYIASVGVAHNKLRAKLASDLNKPEGICILTDIGFQRLASTRLNICHLPGFGGAEGLKFQQALKNHFGYESLTQVQSLSLETLSSIYEGAGIKLGDSESTVLSLLEKCRGNDDSAVHFKLHNDSLSTSTTLKYCSKRKAFDQLVHLLCCDVRDRLKYIQGRFGREATTVSLKISVPPQRQNGKEINSENRAQTQIWIRAASGLPEVNQMENLISDAIVHCQLSHRDIWKITLTANQMRG